jgi:hypothetical protein
MAGLLLAAGDQGPTGAGYRWLFDHIAAFQVMREPQKFLVLLVLTYAIFFAWGVTTLFERATGTSTLAIAGLAVALPLLYTPNLADGLSGQVRPSSIPAAYATADRAVSRAPSTVLALPWHEYVGFSFTHGVIANPAERTFGSVISGDNVELPGLPTTSTSQRSAYVEALLGTGPADTDFGARVSVLGVGWIALLKTADYTSYSWLRQQRDISLVLDSATVSLFRVDALPLSRLTTSSTVGHTSAAAAVTLPAPGAEGTVPLTGAAVHLPGPSATSRRRSATSYDVVGSGLALTPDPWSPGWHGSGDRTVETAWGTLAVVAPTSGPVSFGRGTLAFGTAVVDALLVLLLTAAIALHRRTPEGATS